MGCSLAGAKTHRAETGQGTVSGLLQEGGKWWQRCCGWGAQPRASQKASSPLSCAQSIPLPCAGLLEVGRWCEESRCSLFSGSLAPSHKTLDCISISWGTFRTWKAASRVVYWVCPLSATAETPLTAPGIRQRRKSWPYHEAGQELVGSGFSMNGYRYGKTWEAFATRNFQKPFPSSRCTCRTRGMEQSTSVLRRWGGGLSLPAPVQCCCHSSVPAQPLQAKLVSLSRGHIAFTSKRASNSDCVQHI